MENLISIPYTVDMIDGIENISIDMSDLKFDCPDDKKKFYAFIFLRNTAIKADLIFDKCSFKDKEEYLKMFLTSEIEIKCPILASTWIEILSFNGKLVLQSILNEEEMQIFIKNNKDFINNVYQLINSLPVYTVYKFNEVCELGLSTDDIERVDYNNIKLVNFSQLSEITAFNLLLEVHPPYERRPLFYNKLFNKDHDYDLMKITEKLPYASLINLMLADKNIQDEVIDSIL